MEYYENYYYENKNEILEKMKNKREVDKIKNPLQVKINQMVISSKKADIKKRNGNKWDNPNWRYNECDYINKEFLNELWIKQNGLCYYENCKCNMSLTFNKVLTEYEDGFYEYKHDLNKVSIQRLDNAYPHIKKNCVLCCLKCNLTARKN